VSFEVIGKTSNEPLAEVTLYGLLYYAEASVNERN
jgi:hypothetical protein